jgi:hypothetical protein
MADITHYQAQIDEPGHYFSLREPLTDEAALMLANRGTTPGRITPALRDRADRLKAALLAGRVVRTATAEISPLTAADFAAGRLTPVTGCEEI